MQKVNYHSANIFRIFTFAVMIKKNHMKTGGLEKKIQMLNLDSVNRLQRVPNNNP